MISKDHSLLSHFGLSHTAVFWDEIHERYAERIRSTVQGRRLTAVIGRFGSGKSVLVREALRDMRGCQLVYVSNPDKENLRIGQVASALVAGLSSEAPRRDMIARTTQLARLVGERVVRQKREVALVIENAHRLHANTLLALKDLREAAIYKGIVPLFSVVLVGQEPLLSKIERYGEVRYRTKPIELSEAQGWMDYAQRLSYLDAVYGEAIATPTRERLAAMHASPLELDHVIEGKLELMRDAGIQVMDERSVPFTIREQREAFGLSQTDLEKRTGQHGGRIPRSTISDVEHGRNADPELKRRLQAALRQVAEERKNGALAA